MIPSSLLLRVSLVLFLGCGPEFREPEQWHCFTVAMSYNSGHTDVPTCLYFEKDTRQELICNVTHEWEPDYDQVYLNLAAVSPICCHERAPCQSTASVLGEYVERASFHLHFASVLCNALYGR